MAGGVTLETFGKFLLVQCSRSFGKMGSTVRNVSNPAKNLPISRGDWSYLHSFREYGDARDRAWQKFSLDTHFRPEISQPLLELSVYEAAIGPCTAVQGMAFEKFELLKDGP